MRPASANRMLTPPEIAARFRVKPETVIGWIRSGELRAIDVSRQGSRRPRFRIDPGDLIAFANRRAVAVAPSKRSRRRQKPQNDVIKFF